MLFFFFFLPHLALINGPLLTFTHAPPDVRKLPPAILPVLSFSLFALLSLPLLLLFSPSASTRFVFPCPSPFQTSGFRASYFGLRVFGFSVLYLLLSFLKVNCSPRCCFSACERGEVPADYLAVKMIKVAETSASVHSCRLHVSACTRGMCVHMFARCDRSAPCV